MRYPPEQAAIFIDAAQRVMDSDKTPDVKLRELWLALITLHGMALNHQLQKKIGHRVASGPFKGMQITPDTLGYASGSVLLGCYEHELHATFERVIATPYKQILNIGCSFGYYSVGLALRMPQIDIYSFDIDAHARERCQAMAELNGVRDRVKIAGAFRGEDFASYASQKTLALVDIEGAEMQLLDPLHYPALQKLDIIVELHDCLDPAISKTIMERFAPSHDIEFVRNRIALFPFEEALDADVRVDPIENLLITNEMRQGPTPWAVMRTKS